MYRLMRFYNQNRKAIIRAILIIVLFCIVLIIVNNNAKNNNKISNTNNNAEIVVSNNVPTDKSLITGEAIDTKELNKDTQLIENFLNCCKSDEIEKAYNDLSNSCKEQQFKTIQDFKIIYINLFFSNKNVIYNIENWFDHTYKITIKENALSTGRTSDYNKQDYITIVNENGEIKLNIDGYINTSEINLQKTFDGIKINVIDKLQYMDYTVLNIEVENNTDFDFLLDDLENIRSTYIEDNNGVKYSLYTHEIAKNELLVLPKQSRKIRLKFYSKHISTKKINKIVFSNVILNYGENNVEQKTNYSIEI